MLTEAILAQAEILKWLEQYRGPRFQAVLGDAPYGLGFMNLGWDSFTPQTYQRWVTEWASLLIEQALYPGAVAAFFGGRETWHRLACGLEDAGFEIEDTLMWVYGQGWAKSKNVSKAIDQRGADDRAGAEFKAMIARSVAASGKTRTQINHECGFTMRFDTPPEREGWGGVSNVRSVARFVRGMALQEKSQIYVEAARGLGASTPDICIRYILPNILPP